VQAEYKNKDYNMAKHFPVGAPKVFISSTVDDLVKYREAAANAARRAGFHAVLSEDWEAKDKHPLSECMQRVDETHLTVAIIAERYGWVPEDQDGHKSITWLECEQSGELLVFIAAEDAELDDSKSEDGRNKLARLRNASTEERMSIAAEVIRNTDALDEFKAWAVDGRQRKEFTTPENLGRLIENALRTWLDGHPDFKKDEKLPGRSADAPLVPEDYLSNLKNSVSRVELLGLDLKESITNGLPQVYVPAVTQAGMRDEEKPKEAGHSSRLLLELLGDSSLYVPGDPGSGKSTFCRWVAYVVANGGVPEHEIPAPDELRESLPNSLRGKLPLLVPMRDFADYINCGRTDWSRKDLERALCQWVDRKADGLTADILERNLQQGNTLLLIDGVDEVPETLGEGLATCNPRNALLSGLSAALPKWIKAGNRVLMTSRPYGLSSGQRSQVNLDAVQLLPLNQEGQRLFISRWYAAADHSQWRTLGDGLIKEMTDRAELEPLRENPLLLTALCVKFKEGKRLPHDIMKLFDSVVEQVLFNRYRGSDLERTKVRMRLEVAALAMQWGSDPEHRLQVPRPEVSVTEIEQALARYAQANPATEGGAILVAERCEDLLVNSGLLLPVGERKVSFYHLIFQDFLAAARLVRENKPFANMLTEYARHPEWRRCLMFQFALEVDKDGGIDMPLKQLESLLEQASPEALSRSVAPALVLADCLEIARGKASAEAAGLGVWRGHFQKVCGDSLEHVAEPKDRNELWLALGRMGWDTRPGIGLDGEGLPDIEWLPVTKDENAGPAFYIARYPVTNSQFQAFIMAGDGYADKRWWAGFGDRYQPPGEPYWSEPNAPRESIEWYAAVAFCRWLTLKERAAKPGWKISLPTDEQWRVAYVGTSDNNYPWGSELQPERHANVFGSSIQRTSVVGLFPAGEADSHALDMAGNLWEWCLDKNDDPGLVEADASNEPRVLRGGSWLNDPGHARSAFRLWLPPAFSLYRIGFRVICSGPL
jgi:formylglycine-generating enzyme required for sulfatase activity